MDDPDLHRQRRNLMAISVALVVFDLADASVGEVSILGTKLIVGRPAVIGLAAWVMWAYFLLRYFQFWNESPGTRKLMDEVSNRVNRYVGRFVTRRAKKLTNLRTSYNLLGGLWDGRYQIIQYEDPVIEASAKPTQRRGQAKSSLLEDGQISGRLIAFYRIKAFISVSLRTTQFTEQLLPYLVAAAPPLLAAYEWLRPYASIASRAGSAG